MLILVVFVLLIGLALIGYGYLLVRILDFFKIFHDPALSLSDYSLIGIFVVITLAMVGNFFIPLSDFSGAVTVSLGIILLILFHVKGNLLTEKKNLMSLLIMAFLGVIVMVKLETVSAFFYYKTFQTFFNPDTGLYHMPFLQWIASHSLPLGLANLHGRFGFNSSWLIFHSALRSPWIGWSSLLMVEGWIWTLGIWVLGEGLINRWTKFRVGNRLLLMALALIFFINFGINESGRATSTDYAPNIFTLLTVVYFLEFLEANTQQDQPESQRGILLMILSSCLAITGKLSMLPVSLLPIVGLLMVARSPAMQRSLGIFLGLGILFFTLWILRNFLLSGCWVYPVAATCQDQVSWGVGSQQARIEKDTVNAWARLPGSNYLKSLNNYDWLPDWFYRHLGNRMVKIFLILPLSGLLLPVFEILRLKYYQENRKNLVQTFGLKMIILTAILGLVLWFFNGPDPRFSWSFLVLGSVPVCAFWLALFNATKLFDFLANVFQKKITDYVLVVLIGIILVQHSSQLFDLTAWEKAPDVTFRQQNLSKTGQTIYIPLETDQCWAITPPCTPYFSDKLSLDTIWGHTRFRKSL